MFIFVLFQIDLEKKREVITYSFALSAFFPNIFSLSDAAVKPKAAVCMPELKTVRIASSDDPAILYIPSCTRVERCGGCCSHTLLTCQPTATETVSFQVKYANVISRYLIF